MDDFGVRVRAARVAAGLTQLELARAMGYSTRSTISRIESGDNQVPMDRLDALAAALRTTPAYLLGQDGAAAEPAAPQAAAPEDDPFLQEFWRCAMSLRRDQQEMLLRLMREMGGRR
ncbi:MAG: helix-turn-helix domain-containing protein [Clostridiales bacterium]|nr:helix-turn-helix domain-containing protein [Clostridiales bacterium]